MTKNKSGLAKYFRKGDLVKTLVLLLSLTAIPAGLTALRYFNSLYTQAKGNQVKVYFAPDEVNLEQEQAVDIIADSGDIAVRFMRFAVSFDNSRVQLAATPTTGDKLPNVVRMTPVNEANEAGRVEFHLATPVNQSTAPNGAMKLATLRFRPLGQYDSTQNVVVRIPNNSIQIVDNKAFSFGAALSSLTLKVGEDSSYDDPETDPVPQGRVVDGLFHFYSFDEGSGVEIADTSPNSPQVKLLVEDPERVSWIDGGIRINRPTLIRSNERLYAYADRLKETNQFTLEAWIRPASEHQDGPARIITMSDNTWRANFTLGQGKWLFHPRNVFDMRFRHTSSDLIGRPSFTTDAGTLTTDLVHVAYTAEAGGKGRFYINGNEVGSRDIEGDFSNWDRSYYLGLANEITFSRPWLGEYYLLGLYDRSLSSSEVLQNYNAGPNGQNLADSPAPQPDPAPDPDLDPGDGGDSSPPTGNVPDGAYNVRDYGANPGDANEDTSSIQNAINAAGLTKGVVYIPAGEYIVGSLKLPEGVTVMGEPSYKTVLRLKNSLGGDRNSSTLQSQTGLLMSADFMRGAKTNNVTVKDFVLLGNSANQWGGGPMPGGSDSIHGISILAGDNWLVERVRVEDFDGDGIYIGGRDDGEGSFRNKVNDCIITKNLRNGISIIHGDENRITNCKVFDNQQGIIEGTPKYSPQMYKAGEIDLEPNVSRQTARYNIFENNEFGPGPGDGFVLSRPGTDTSGNIIRNNVFRDFARYQFAIWTAEASNNLIENNKFIASSPGSVNTHIVVGRAQRNCIRGNTLEGGSNQPNSSFILVRQGASETAIIGNKMTADSGLGDGKRIRVLSGTQATYINENELSGVEVDARSTVVTQTPGFCR